MQQSKIGLDFNQVEHARNIAKKIANQVQDFVGGYTTVAVERTICRLLGIDVLFATLTTCPYAVNGGINVGLQYFLDVCCIMNGQLSDVKFAGTDGFGNLLGLFASFGNGIS